jgi:hypothetical protein
VLSNLKRLPKFDNPAEMKPFFVQMRTELEELLADEYEAQAFYYFDILSWIDSKVGRTSFSEAFKARNGVGEVMV